MQATAYEGYFENGRFYVSGRVVQIPEQRRIFLTILEDAQSVSSDKQAAWNDFKRMVKDTPHENHLLTEDVFRRDNSSREFIHFSDGVDGV